jgi:predicted phosphohydrolase
MFSFIKRSIEGPNTPFDPPSLLHRLLCSPIKTLVQFLYALLLFLRGPAFPPPSNSSRIRLVCISDTHTQKPASIPPGDVLIHAGDLTNLGSVEEIQAQIDWLSSLPHPYKLVIAGNHDSFFDPRSRRTGDVGQSIRWGSVRYLQHSSIILEFPKQGGRRLFFYGAPQIPECGGEEFAFQYPRDKDAWSETIPRETDVLITHTPPRHHLDLPAGLGCEFLRQEVWRVRPRVHVFGHVHAGYGRKYMFWDDGQRAFERLCGRETQGWVQGFCAIGLRWLDLTRLIRYGVQGIVWTRVWGGDDRGGIMINASLMYRSSGKLLNWPQVVDI